VAHRRVTRDGLGPLTLTLPLPLPLALTLTLTLTLTLSLSLSLSLPRTPTLSLRAGARYLREQAEPRQAAACRVRARVVRS